MLLVRVAAEKALPFEARVPNAETIEAIEAGRRGDVASFRSVKELMADLNAED
jgi:DNA-damage-inducible protein J